MAGDPGNAIRTQPTDRTPTSSGKLVRCPKNATRTPQNTHQIRTTQNTHFFRKTGQVILETQLEHNRLTEHPPLQENWPGDPGNTIRTPQNTHLFRKTGLVILETQ